MTRKINVRYFASLREQAGHSQEWVTTEALTARDLYAQLVETHRFTLEEKHLKLSINREYKAFDSVLGEGDEVVFIPPVSGG